LTFSPQQVDVTALADFEPPQQQDVSAFASSFFFPNSDMIYSS